MGRAWIGYSKTFREPYDKVPGVNRGELKTGQGRGVGVSWVRNDQKQLGQEILESIGLEKVRNTGGSSRARFRDGAGGSGTRGSGWVRDEGNSWVRDEGSR
jgi:hypothetical protein